METESISVCLCGLDLRLCHVNPSNDADLWFSNFLFNKCETSSIKNDSLSSKLGIYLWFLNVLKGTKTDSKFEFMNFINHFPNSLYKWLEAKANTSFETQVKNINRTGFGEFYGEGLFKARNLPFKDNLIKNHIVIYLVDQLSTKNKFDISALLFTVSESASILSTTYDDIYRLYEEGYLIAKTRLTKQAVIPVYLPVFTLGNVLGLYLSGYGETKQSSR